MTLNLDPIGPSVGNFVRRFRLQHGITRSQLRDAGRAWGLTWSNGSVRDLERGNTSLPLRTSIVLTHALNDLSGESVVLADLVAGAIEKFDAIAPAIKRVPTLAEERAAKKLGVSPATVAGKARRLWGHTVDDEATKRAGEGASPQARGHVTRQLIKELQEADT